MIRFSLAFLVAFLLAVGLAAGAATTNAQLSGILVHFQASYYTT